MKKLTRFLLFVLPVFLAGYAAWSFIPCREDRSYPVPNETKLLEFSPAGNYVVTFHLDNNHLSLWRVDTGELAFTAELPCRVKPNESINGTRAFYGFSYDDRWLAVATGSLVDSRIAIVDLASSNTTTSVAVIPPGLGPYRPQPAFSTDGRYLSYFSERGLAENCGVLYDIASRHEQLTVPGAFSSLGPPTREGKWFFHGKKGVECWDVMQKKRDDEFPPWLKDHTMISTSLSPDEQSVSGLCIAEASRFPTEHIFLNRCDLKTRTIENAWEYTFPPSAHLFWNVASSDPQTFLLIKTLDDQGKLVQDLLEVSTGKVLARYSQPINMLVDVSYSYQGQAVPIDMGAGLIHTVGRTGEIAIDSERRVLVSKQTNLAALRWRYFVSWFGFRRGPRRPYLTFHSAQTGELLERVSLQTPYKPFDPVLAMHPSKPLLVVIDEQLTGPLLQFWHVPPPKPWGWILLCALAAGACAALMRIGYSRIRKRRHGPSPSAESAL
jgi:hypothetical protein